MQFTRRFGKHPSRENSAKVPQTAFLLKCRLGGGLLTSFLRRNTTTQAKSQASIIHIVFFTSRGVFLVFFGRPASAVNNSGSHWDVRENYVEAGMVGGAGSGFGGSGGGWRGKRGKHVEEALPGKAGAHALQTLPSRAPLAPDQSLSHPSAEGKVNYFDNERSFQRRSQVASFVHIRRLGDA